MEPPLSPPLLPPLAPAAALRPTKPTTAELWTLLEDRLGSVALCRKLRENPELIGRIADGLGFAADRPAASASASAALVERPPHHARMSWVFVDMCVRRPGRRTLRELQMLLKHVASYCTLGPLHYSIVVDSLFLVLFVAVAGGAEGPRWARGRPDALGAICRTGAVGGSELRGTGRRERSRGTGVGSQAGRRAGRGQRRALR